MVLVRIRVRFDFAPINYARKCWFVFDSDQCRRVQDVAYLISAHFDLENSQDGGGLELYMDDYLIPADESSQIIRDNDLIEVKAVHVPSNKPSLSDSSPDIQPKAKRKKRLKTKLSPSEKSSPETPAKAVTSTPKPPSPTPVVKPARPLRAVSSKSASGGTHTKFRSSSSSSSSSSESSSSEDEQLPVTKKSVPRKQQNSTSSKTVSKSPKVTTKTSPVKNAVIKSNGKTPPVSKQQTRKNKQNSNNQRTNFRQRNIPSHVIVGGPSDVHTTISNVYTQVNSNGSTAKITRQNSSKKQTSTTKVAKTRENSRTENKGEENLANSSQVVESVSMEPARNYDALPDLQGPPRVGDKLAFKMLELSSTCTPEISDYKEADVLSYDVASKTLRVKYTETTLKKMKQAAESDGPSVLERFMLDDEEGDEDGNKDSTGDASDISVAELSLDSLISPKLINN